MADSEGSVDPHAPFESDVFKRQFITEETKVTFSTPDGVQLAGELSSIDDPGEHSRLGVILAHSHPSFGGNMHNNVVHVCFRTLSRAGFPCLRFNFRGVSPSRGRGTWRGSGEQDDVRAAVRYMRETGLVDRIVLVGYSMGSVYTSSVADEFDDVPGFVSIAFPFGVLAVLLHSSFLEKARSTKPQLWMIGDRDNFTSLKRFTRQYDALPQNKQRYSQVFEQIDHFFFREEGRVASRLQVYLWCLHTGTDASAWFERAVQPPNPETVGSSCSVQ